MMVDAWVECAHCGHRRDQHAPQCIADRGCSCALFALDVANVEREPTAREIAKVPPEYCPFCGSMNLEHLGSVFAEGFRVKCGRCRRRFLARVLP